MSADWTEPGVERVAPGVHRIPLPLPQDGLRAVNVYTVETTGGLVLVDGGWAIPQAKALLESGLASIGASLGDIRRSALVTHVHRDHYTQAVEVRRSHGARVGLGAGERPTLELLQRRDGTPLRGQLDLLRAFGAPALAELIAGFATDPVELALWEAPDEWLEPGQLRLDGGRTLEAVATPGHTPPGILSSTTAQLDCSSPATTCCRASHRRSASSRCRHLTRSVRSCARWRSCARDPTRCCCPRTDRSHPACTPASTSWSTTTVNGST